MVKIPEKCYGLLQKKPCQKFPQYNFEDVKYSAGEMQLTTFTQQKYSPHFQAQSMFLVAAMVKQAVYASCRANSANKERTLIRRTRLGEFNIICRMRKLCLQSF